MKQTKPILLTLLQCSLGYVELLIQKQKYGAIEQEQIIEVEHKWQYMKLEDIATLPKYSDLWTDLIPVFIEHFSDKHLNYKIALN
jgi:hypothetical protein